MKMTGRLACESSVIVDEQMSWTSITDRVLRVGWKLRYDRHGLSESDCLIAASVISAYQQMVCDPQDKRNAVCKAIRDASATSKGEADDRPLGAFTGPSPSK